MIVPTGEACPYCGGKIVIPHVSVLRDGIICTPCSNKELIRLQNIDIISDHDHCVVAKPQQA